MPKHVTIDAGSIDRDQAIVSFPLAGAANGSYTLTGEAAPSATNGMGRSSVEVNQGNLRSVNVVTAGDRTRLVLDLKTATGYKAQ